MDKELLIMAAELRGVIEAAVAQGQKTITLPLAPLKAALDKLIKAA